MTRRGIGWASSSSAARQSRPRANRCSSISANPNMRIDALEFLRCPYCGGRFELDASQFHNRAADQVIDGILSCQCCNLPVVDGIPVLPLLPDSTAALDDLRGARPDQARRLMFGLDDPARAEA